MNCRGRRDGPTYYKSKPTMLFFLRFFPCVSAYVAAVPTYVGGFMTLGFAARKMGLDRVPAETIRERAQAAGILGSTQYWTPEVHAAAFHLPPYIAKNLPALNARP